VILNKAAPQRITADKREIKDSPKLPSATSFFRKTLGETATKKGDVVKKLTFTSSSNKEITYHV
jgi:hypothetical protein